MIELTNLDPLRPSTQIGRLNNKQTMAPAPSEPPTKKAGPNPTPEEVDSLKTTRNYIIGAFVLLTVAGQVQEGKENCNKSTLFV